MENDGWWFDFMKLRNLRKNLGREGKIIWRGKIASECLS